MSDKSWQDALAQAGLAGHPDRTRREQISLARSRERRLGTIPSMLRVAGAVLITQPVLGWLLMTMAGILHAQWWLAIPAMSYATAFPVSCLLLAVTGIITALAIYVIRA
jgi:uncharacterized membrane protein